MFIVFASGSQKMWKALYLSKCLVYRHKVWRIFVDTRFKVDYGLVPDWSLQRPVME